MACSSFLVLAERSAWTRRRLRWGNVAPTGGAVIPTRPSPRLALRWSPEILPTHHIPRRSPCHLLKGMEVELGLEHWQGEDMRCVAFSHVGE